MSHTACLLSVPLDVSTLPSSPVQLALVHRHLCEPLRPLPVHGIVCHCDRASCRHPVQPWLPQASVSKCHTCAESWDRKLVVDRIWHMARTNACRWQLCSALACIAAGTGAQLCSYSCV
jgi:hypothetical protein